MDYEETFAPVAKKTTIRTLIVVASVRQWHISQLALRDLTVLPTEFFRRSKTHILSIINLPTESPTEMIRH